MRVNGYGARLDRVEAAASKRTGGAIMVFREYGDSDETVRAKIAAAGRARGLRPDDESANVVIFRWLEPGE